MKEKEKEKLVDKKLLEYYEKFHCGLPLRMMPSRLRMADAIIEIVDECIKNNKPYKPEKLPPGCIS